jgi:hypothetical protein
MDKPAKPPDSSSSRLLAQYLSRSWRSTGSWKRICSGMRDRPARTTGLRLFAWTGHAAVVQRTPSTSPDKPGHQLGHVLAWKCQRKRRRPASKPG